MNDQQRYEQRYSRQLDYARDLALYMKTGSDDDNGGTFARLFNGISIDSQEIKQHPAYRDLVALWDIYSNNDRYLDHFVNPDADFNAEFIKYMVKLGNKVGKIVKEINTKNTQVTESNDNFSISDLQRLAGIKQI